MSKRFILCKKGDDAEYIEDNNCIQLYNFEVVCEMLNSLNDENEQLRKERNNIAEECSALFKQNGRLKKENEQLRNSISEFLEEADLFSENAIDHDIVAFREMMKFDNKDAFAIAYAIAELKKVIDDE